MKQKLTLLLMTIACLSFFGQQNALAQSLKKSAQQIRQSLDELNLDKFIALYADTVHYVDPNYGSDDMFSKATVRSFYEPMFQANSTTDLKILTIAIDDKEGSILVRGTAYDITEKGRLPFVVFFKFEKGKIVHQMDFPVYSVESLKAAPRYKGYFK